MRLATSSIGPTVEGLRIDEAMHPLTLLAVGLYGHDAAEPERRAAAPGRAVEVRLQGHQVDRQDRVRRDATEDDVERARVPDEYGFYANVNPDVDHPRWSQSTERRIAGDGFNVFGNRTPTLPFNGYADQVASLYAGMDLRRNF